MGLNIKNPETYRLAAALAKRKGQTMTRVITDALRKELEADKASAKARQTRKYAELEALVREFHAHLTPEQRAFNIDEELYDEFGLPK